MRANIENQKQNPPNPLLHNSPLEGRTRNLFQGGIQNPNTKHSNTITLILDGINDPGNLGTIIRTADWYGISHIICSLDTVDCYNSKVLMATMGSFVRVHVEYRDLEEYLVSIIAKNEAIQVSDVSGHGLLHPKGTSNPSQRGATSQ